MNRRSSKMDRYSDFICLIYMYHNVTCKEKNALHYSKQLHYKAFVHGTPIGTRTPNLLVRSQTLYPIELWAHHISNPKIKDFSDTGITRLNIHSTPGRTRTPSL